MSNTCGVALPTIDTPSPGMRFEDWIQATNVFDAIERTQRRCAGGKTAITFLGTEPEAPPHKLSYTQLVEGIARTANAFRSLGLRRGDVVAYMLPSLVETQFVLWGAATAASALPLNPLLKAEEIASLCRAAGVKALVALGPLPGTEIWDKAERVRALVPAIGALIQVGGEKAASGAKVHLLADLLRSNSRQLAFSDLPEPDDVAAYFHTGGTTGAPKLVIHTHRNQLAAAYGGAWAVGACTDDVIVNGLPMFHVASAIFCSLAMFVAGAEVVILSPAGFRNPQIVANFWRIVERTGTTIVGGVPTALSAVVKVDPKGADLSRVRINICGASLLPRSVAEQMELLTGKPMREVYGMTEAGGVICVDPVSRARVMGSAGCPIPFCEVEARALAGTSASSRSCMPGEAGMLVVRGPNVTPGYKDAGQSASLFTEDGWLITGDVGYVDATGRVFITGRAKDLIIRGGHNIDPAVIEECLMRHPAVADAGAVGMLDAYAGEVPVVYVTLRQGASVTEDELLAFAKATINEPPALPRRLFVLEQLPMTAVGKIYKPALRQDCTRQHLLEVLQGESIAALTVREEPGRGLVVCIELAAAEEDSSHETRQRIAADLKGYLLTLEWASSQASPS
ncbi:fatty-acyl-CoA synthase [Variovorax sp. CF079]|uniref:AMP-binding protein n=1 Tax=Variovorax sp. CF079 TaxID=1882774 RepID=UPI000890AA1E|nr:AMP-binding protein [Variovorax sp. CF079]SDE48798.1 fatty-acyl-CoA synthase [Variovorax sp. CF079]